MEYTTGVPLWMLLASGVVWLFALGGLAALLRTIWQFVNRSRS
jgi:hypothetical protein